MIVSLKPAIASVEAAMNGSAVRTAATVRGTGRRSSRTAMALSAVSTGTASSTPSSAESGSMPVPLQIAAARPCGPSG